MKKLFVLFLMICLLVCGCGKKSEAQATSTETIGEENKVEIMQVPKNADGSINVEKVAEEIIAYDYFVDNNLENDYLPQLEEPKKGSPTVTMETSMGTIEMVLYPDAAPKAVENFLGLCEKGYYDGLKFHRVIDNFMIQGGSPDGMGYGGESIWGGKFDDEISTNLHHFRGALAMANSGINSNGSQFYIVQSPDTTAASPYFRYNQINQKIQRYVSDVGGLQDLDEAGNKELTKLLNDYLSSEETDEEKVLNDKITKAYEKLGGTFSLDYQYTVLGQVTSGMDVVDAIAKVEKNDRDCPNEDILIISTKVGKIE